MLAPPDVLGEGAGRPAGGVGLLPEDPDGALGLWASAGPTRSELTLAIPRIRTIWFMLPVSSSSVSRHCPGNAWHVAFTSARCIACATGSHRDPLRIFASPVGCYRGAHHQLPGRSSWHTAPIIASFSDVSSDERFLIERH